MKEVIITILGTATMIIVFLLITPIVMTFAVEYTVWISNIIHSML